jgi:hypothetical protein
MCSIYFIRMKNKIIILAFLLLLGLTGFLGRYPLSRHYYERGMEARQQELFEESLNFFIRALKLRGGFPEARFELAMGYAILNDDREAVKMYTWVTSLDEKHGRAWFFRGVSNSVIGDHEASREDFTRAISLGYEPAMSHTGRGKALQNLNDNEGALADFSRAIMLDPDLGQAWFHRGVLKANMGDYTVPLKIIIWPSGMTRVILNFTI